MRTLVPAFLVVDQDADTGAISRVYVRIREDDQAIGTVFLYPDCATEDSDLPSEFQGMHGDKIHKIVIDLLHVALLEANDGLSTEMRQALVRLDECGEILSTKDDRAKSHPGQSYILDSGRKRYAVTSAPIIAALVLAGKITRKTGPGGGVCGGWVRV